MNNTLPSIIDQAIKEYNANHEKILASINSINDKYNFIQLKQNSINNGDEDINNKGEDTQKDVQNNYNENKSNKKEINVAESTLKQIMRTYSLIYLMDLNAIEKIAAKLSSIKLGVKQAKNGKLYG